MKRWDYVVANDDTPMSDPAWDIGIVQFCNRVMVRVWWLLADYTEPLEREAVREATHEEYNYAREEKGIDR